MNFDATGSTDADNDIATYMFDFQSDGSYDVINATGKTSYTYSADGNYTAKVLVIDAQDHSSSTTVQISVGQKPEGPSVSCWRLQPWGGHAAGDVLCRLQLVGRQRGKEFRLGYG